ncbi:hypothetical protein [Paramagnetospirillum kuznetsovii]|nr:hypothetical protein [Paramagnetospirillum kuznetsovii]
MTLSEPARAGCENLLGVESAPADKTADLSLTSCDVDTRIEDGGRTSQIRFHLRGAAGDAWKAALGPGGRLFPELLKGDLKIRPNAGGIPAAPLLSAASARGAAAHAWQWDEKSMSLGIAPSDPVSATDAMRCPSDAAGVLLLWPETIEVAPRSLIAPRLYRSKYPGNYEPVSPSCVAEWRLSDGAPAVIHPALGLSIVAANSRDGKTFSLRARLVGHPESKFTEGAVRVVNPTLHPLAGSWSETEERPCEGSAWTKPAQPIGELTFDASGAFSVTRQPFEAYRDYWGTYRYAATSSALTLSVTDGNAIPANRRLKGTARLGDSGTLELEGLLPQEANARPICAHRFTRR